MPESKKKRIVVFHPAIAPYRVDFFKRLNQEFAVDFFFEHQNVPNQNFDQKALIERVHFTPKYLNRGFKLMNRSIRFGIFKILRRNKPDIVLCSEFGQVTISVILYNWLSRKKIKVYTLSDDNLDLVKSRKGMRASFRNFVARNVEGIIYPSTEVCDWFSKNISTKTKMLELPIIHSDIQFTTFLKESLPESRKIISKFELNGQKLLLFVGRLAQEKNIPFLIQALAKVRARDWKLVIVGSGDQEDVLRMEIAKFQLSDKILLVGRKENEELYAWYAIAGIFVLPSFYEPFGAVVNEALIGGCSVLCSKSAGARTLITAQNGSLFDPENVDELVVKLELALEKAEMISENSGLQLRKNLMPFGFEEKLEQLFASL